MGCAYTLFLCFVVPRAGGSTAREPVCPCAVISCAGRVSVAAFLPQVPCLSTGISADPSVSSPSPMVVYRDLGVAQGCREYRVIETLGR